MAKKAELVTIEKPSPPSLVNELSGVVKAAQDFTVDNMQAHAIALERSGVLRKGEKAITDYYEPTRKKFDEAKKELLRARDGMIAPFAAARRVYDGKAQQYEQEERRKAEERERELREKARKEEEDRQLMAAIEAEESGDTEAAEQILDEKVDTPAVTVAPQVARVSGVSSRTVWKAEVFDVNVCLRHMLDDPGWAATLEKIVPVLETALRPLATAQHEAMSIPGARAVSEQVRSYR